MTRRMSLPDGAEYWWDVKGYNRRPKHVYTHIKGLECGHYHGHESTWKNQIDCRSCKQSEVYQSMQAWPKCCGKPMVERKNKSTGEMFFGCKKYPTCRNTQSINPSPTNKQQ